MRRSADVLSLTAGHDTPWITVTGEAREAHIEAALSGDCESYSTKVAQKGD